MELEKYKRGPVTFIPLYFFKPSGPKRHPVKTQDPENVQIFLGNVGGEGQYAQNCWPTAIFVCKIGVAHLSLLSRRPCNIESQMFLLTYLSLAIKAIVYAINNKSEQQLPPKASNPQLWCGVCCRIFLSFAWDRTRLIIGQQFVVKWYLVHVSHTREIKMAKKRAIEEVEASTTDNGVQKTKKKKTKKVSNSQNVVFSCFQLLYWIR